MTETQWIEDYKGGLLQLKGINELTLSNGNGQTITRRLGNFVYVEYCQFRNEFLRKIRPFDLEHCSVITPMPKQISQDSDLYKRYAKIRPRIAKEVNDVLNRRNNCINYARIFLSDEDDEYEGDGMCYPKDIDDHLEDMKKHPKLKPFNGLYPKK